MPRRLHTARSLVMFPLLLGLSLGRLSAADLSLHIPGIAGNGTTPGHVGDIALQSLNFGVANSGGTAYYGQVTVTKKFDPASPVFSLEAANGGAHNTVTIYQTRTNGVAVDVMTVTLQNAYVSSQSIRVATDGTRAELLSLQAKSITCSYAPQ